MDTLISRFENMKIEKIIHNHNIMVNYYKFNDKNIKVLGDANSPLYRLDDILDAISYEGPKEAVVKNLRCKYVLYLNNNSIKEFYIDSRGFDIIMKHFNTKYQNCIMFTN